jgi:hypothetical protein
MKYPGRVPAEAAKTSSGKLLACADRIHLSPDMAKTCGARHPACLRATGLLTINPGLFEKTQNEICTQLHITPLANLLASHRVTSQLSAF